MVPIKYINAKKIMDWYIERCEEACTTEAQSALEYIHIQLASHKASSMVNMLQSYPITLTEVTD